MVLTVGKLYTISVGSGNTHTAINWGQKIPDNANKVLRTCVLEITEDIRNTEQAAGDKWDYRVNIYDMKDDSHWGTKINSAQSDFIESGWKTPQMRAEMKKRKKRRKVRKHEKKKHSSKKRRRSRKRRKSKRRRKSTKRK